MTKIDSDKVFINGLLLTNPETGDCLMIGGVHAEGNNTILSMTDSTGKVVWKHTITTEEI